MAARGTARHIVAASRGRPALEKVDFRKAASPPLEPRKRIFNERELTFTCFFRAYILVKAVSLKQEKELF
ncbi:MAG: hypothetical protein DRH43_03010 [Deltaproteobacteria bacterium]|nr:MAG: hypothetical protein DRH43_03010 [Deltaproteobacteria bacterium]